MPSFVNLYHLIDAAMLFGAMLEPQSLASRSVRMVAGRAQTQWSTLYWLLTVMHRHGVRMSLCVGGRTIPDKLAFATHASVFYFPAFERWYPGFATTGRCQAVTPGDLQIDQSTLIVWLADAMAKSSRRDKAVRLMAPRMTLQIAKSLSAQVKALGWTSSVEPTATYYAIKLQDKRKAQRWLSGHVPPSVWGGDQ